MYLYEKIIEVETEDGTELEKHIFATALPETGLGADIPREDDEQVVYKNSQGEEITPSREASYFDDKKGGIIDEDGEHVIVFANDKQITGGEIEESPEEAPEE